MNRTTRNLSILLAAGLAGFALTSMGDAKPAVEVELEEAKVFVEWNSTDNDFGIQFFWDGEPWRDMTVRDGSGNTVLTVKPKGSVRTHGLTEGFFESAEPPAEELSMEEFFERFPEEEYEFRGAGLEGGILADDAEFTHTLPAPPTNLSPAASAVVNHTGFTAGFDPVTQDIGGNPIVIAYYEVIVEKENDEPILQVFSVILRPSQTSVSIPGEFLEPDTEYKMEVIAVEEGGNKTITESGTFTTTSDT